jgi:hypothetical protein
LPKKLKSVQTSNFSLKIQISTCFLNLKIQFPQTHKFQHDIISYLALARDFSSHFYAEFRSCLEKRVCPRLFFHIAPLTILEIAREAIHGAKNILVKIFSIILFNYSSYVANLLARILLYCSIKLMSWRLSTLKIWRVLGEHEFISPGWSIFAAGIKISTLSCANDVLWKFFGWNEFWI